MDSYEGDGDPIPDMDEREQQQQCSETLVDFLLHNPDMRTTARGSLRQGLMAGGGAVLGGILLGPVGGLVGGIAGSVVGYVQGNGNSYDGVVVQIQKLPEARQRRLVEQVRASLLTAGAGARGMSTSAELQATLVQFASQSQVRDEIWKACLEAMEEQ
jgi:hypothetical protein